MLGVGSSTCCALVGGLWFVGGFEAGGALACAAAGPGDARFPVQGSPLWFRFVVLRGEPPTALFKAQIQCFCIVLGCVTACDCLNVSVWNLTL